MFKHVLILANSVKRGDHCVAGREIKSDGKQYSFGKWIRPMGAMHEGALSTADVSYLSGKQASVLEFVEMHLDGKVATSAQPENWRNQDGQKWKTTKEYALPTKKQFDDLLAETPTDLWLEPSRNTDRASEAFIQQDPPKQSLYLIRPHDFYIIRETRYAGKLQWRGTFNFKKKQYNLALTDPVITSKYRAKPDVYVKLTDGDDVFLCISLTAPFRGDHYKVIATVIEGSSLG